MATNTSGLSIFPVGDRQNPPNRSPYLAYKHTQLTADTKASSELDLRSWSKSDQKLYQNLQKCRERFAKKQNNDPVVNSVEVSGGTTGVSKRAGLDYLPRYEDVKRASSKCPQFIAVSDGKEYTSKRKRYTFTPRSRSLFDLSKAADDREDRKTGIVVKLPIQVTRLKVEKGAETVSQAAQDREARRRAIAEETETNSSQPPHPTPITIPTGLLNANNLNNNTDDKLVESTTNSAVALVRKVPKRRIVRVATNCGDASPSVSSTAHVLLEKKLSKVMYTFPAVPKPSTAEPDSSFYSSRNTSRQENIVYVKTPVSLSDSPHGVSLPRLPKHCSPYNWLPTDPIDFVSNCNSPSREVTSDVSSSVKTPPTVSLPNTPDSDRQYVQTGEGVFVLNILRSMTVSSLSRMSSSPSLHMFRHRDKSSMPSSRV